MACCWCDGLLSSGFPGDFGSQADPQLGGGGLRKPAASKSVACLPYGYSAGALSSLSGRVSHLLSAQVRQTMQEEVDAVCSSISQLAQSITNLEVRTSRKTQSDSRAVARSLSNKDV